MSIFVAIMKANKEEDKPMTADTLKTTRVLELYQAFLSGKLINKQEAAGQYHVNARSIQRDIDSIRDFLAEQCAKEGIVRRIEYDKKKMATVWSRRRSSGFPRVRCWPCARFCWKPSLHQRTGGKATANYPEPLCVSEGKSRH